MSRRRAAGAAAKGLGWVAGLVLAAAGLACGPSVDLARDLQIVDVQTGWFDAGVVAGKNKLVPDISFALKNVSDHPIRSLQINLAFWRKGEDGEFDDAFVANALGREGLAPGATTPPIRLRGKVGYTGEQPRAEMLQHRLFVDATAKVFVKSGASQWVLLGEFPIERRLLTR
jgi:hypothetical protein